MQKLNWEKVGRSIKAQNGVAYYPWFERTTTPPSKKQIAFVEQLINDLESHGVEVSWLEEISSKQYLLSAEVCYKLTARLVFLRKQHNIPSGTEVTYVNLCKEKDTGKKIKYRTRTRFAVPKGYEFLGELSKEVIILDPRQ